jgi:hypothetical protein
MTEGPLFHSPFIRVPPFFRSQCAHVVYFNQSLFSQSSEEREEYEGHDCDFVVFSDEVKRFVLKLELETMCHVARASLLYCAT